MRRPALIGVLLVGGCLDWEGVQQDGLTVFRAATKAGPRGRVPVDVPVSEDDAAFLLTAVIDPEVLGYVARVVDPAGDEVYVASDWWTSDRNKTNAGFASEVVTLNWPVSEDDAPLVPGTWRVEVQVDDGGVGVDLTLAVKPDASLTDGRLRAEVLFAGDLEDDPTLVAGVARALEIWRDEIYAPAGLEVEVVFREWDGPDRLASPGFGDRAAYLDALGDKDLRQIAILIVSQVTDGSQIFGVSGGIPGPLVGSDRSVVTVSALEAAGLDQVLQPEEERLLSETIAHEVGHYLGLFHPAELPRDGVRVGTWDALTDTPECATFERCVDALAGNLMFPTPVCDPAAGPACAAFVRQTTVTGAQRAVMHRYTGVE